MARRLLVLAPTLACLIAAAPLSVASARAGAVQLTNKAVVIGSAAVHRYLIGVSRDGSTFRFRGTAAGLQRLRPGKVMVLQGSDVVVVVRVRHIRGVLVVIARPAALTDVVRSGTITYRGTPSMRNAFPSPIDAAARAQHASVRQTGPWYPALRIGSGFTGSAAGAGAFQIRGNYEHFGYVLVFTPTSASRLDVSGVLCYQLGTVCSGNFGAGVGFAAEIQVRGYIDLGQADLGFTVNDGRVTHSVFSLAHLLENMHFTYTLTSGTQKDNGDPPILRIPVGIDFEVPVGGVPLYFRVQLALLLKFGITSYNAVIRGGANVTASGSDGYVQNGSHFTGTESGGQVNGGPLTHQNGDVGPSSSYLPSGVVVALQQKIGVGLGIRAANMIGYLSAVTSIGQTVKPAFGGLAGVDCSIYDIEYSLVAGLQSQFGPLKITSPEATLLDRKAEVKETGC